MRFLFRAAALILAAGTCLTPAQALVGPARQGSGFDAHVLMVLKRSAKSASFCSAVVVAQNVVLTAAHCVAGLSDTRIHYRDSAGKPVLASVAQIATHPGFRADAVAARVKSIDIALLRLAEPLPGVFSAARLSGEAGVRVGQTFTIAGFGVAREGAPETSGVLRSGVIAARAPLSSVLLWAEDPAGQGLGACTGDSGGPIFSGDGALVAITDWATGARGKGCGGLTQGALIAPQRAWIDSVLGGWGAR